MDEADSNQLHDTERQTRPRHADIWSDGREPAQARKLRILRCFLIVHCGGWISNPPKVSCITYCFYWLVAGRELKTAI